MKYIILLIKLRYAMKSVWYSVIWLCYIPCVYCLSDNEGNNEKLNVALHFFETSSKLFMAQMPLEVLLIYNLPFKISFWSIWGVQFYFNLRCLPSNTSQIPYWCVIFKWIFIFVKIINKMDIVCYMIFIFRNYQMNYKSLFKV